MFINRGLAITVSEETSRVSLYNSYSEATELKANFGSNRINSDSNLIELIRFCHGEPYPNFSNFLIIFVFFFVP